MNYCHPAAYYAPILPTEILTAEVAGYTFMGGLHRLLAFVPPQRANFAVLLEVLQGIHHAQSLLYGAPQWHIIYHHVAHNALLIDEEESAIGYAFSHIAAAPGSILAYFAGQHIELLGHFLINVRYQRVCHPLYTPLLSWRVGPCPMAELRICGAAHHDRVARFELFQSILETDELGRANKGEIFRVEEKEHILAAAITAQAEPILNHAIHHGICRELRCFLSY